LLFASAVLKGARDIFGMVSHLTLGSVLDRLRFQVEGGRTSYPKAKVVLQSVLAKIGKRVR